MEINFNVNDIDFQKSGNLLVPAIIQDSATLKVLMLGYMNKEALEKTIADIQKKMQKAAAELNFEAAAEYRDKMISLKNMLREL